MNPSPESDPTLLAPPSVSDPAELLRRALDSRPGTGSPHEWEPPAPQDLQASLSGYLVEGFLARGGMGAVYQGEQTSLSRKVAIKILPPCLRESDPQYAERFKREARAMAQLSHPGIVAVYDFGEMADGTLYIVMELIEGIDVAQMVAQNGRLHSEHAMAITAHVCDALQYAHERGVVHRDIKPANIMVGRDGRVKVADFGLAKSLVSQQHLSITQSGFVMGTPHFLAPEAMVPGIVVDHRADIYAIGVMLYQMLTGRLPQGVFEMPSLQVPGLDPRYDQIIVSAMREDREQRYPSVLHLRHALDAILTRPVPQPQDNVPTVVLPNKENVAKGGAAVRERSPQPKPASQRTPQPAAPREKSSAGVWAAVAVAVAVIGAGGWFLLDGKGSAPASASPVGSAPASAPTSGPRLVDTLVFPSCSFNQASMVEVMQYFALKSRDLDPAGKGVNFLAGDAVRNSPVKITMDFQNTVLSELLDTVAHLARLDVTYDQDDVMLAPSVTMKPPYPQGTPTPAQQGQGRTKLPSMLFSKATLAECLEFVRVMTHQLDPSIPQMKILVDPAVNMDKPRITTDMKQVAAADALSYIAAVVGAELVYLNKAYYLQPLSQPRDKLPSGSLPDLGEAGKVILPQMVFRGASIEEAVNFIQLKSRDLDPLKLGVRMITDSSQVDLSQKITLDSRQISFERALAQVAAVTGLDLYPLGGAAVMLRSSTQSAATSTPPASGAGF